MLEGGVRWLVQTVPVRHIQASRVSLDEFPRHYHALLQTVDPAACERSLRELFAKTLKRFKHEISVDYLALGLHDPARSLFIYHSLSPAAAYKLPAEIPLEASLSGLVLADQQPIEVEDIDAETRFPDRLEIAKSQGLRSLRIVPLTTERRKIGAIGAGRPVAGGFSQADIRQFDQLAEVFSLILDNALMADALSREKTRLDTLLDINFALLSTLDFQELLKAASRSMRRLVPHNLTYFALYDEASDAMRITALNFSQTEVTGQPEVLVPVAECPSGIAYRRGETKLFTTADLESIKSGFTNDLLSKGIRQVYCFPLTSRGKRLGSLALASPEQILFSGEDLGLLTQVAAQVATAIDNAVAYSRTAKLKDKLSKEKLYLQDEIRSARNLGEIVGSSPALKKVLQQVEIAAPSDATVLILGETGTGKELVARALHRLSSRREGLVVKLNCAAIPTGLLESELFGHEKGAFTGAISPKIGRLELADKGTLFLDEIGEISSELQPKLLRVLQDHEFERLGGNRTIRVNVRVIAATNRDLATAVSEHQFRSDLYYWLNVFPIHVPPLRDRVEDIAPLVRFLSRALPN